MLGKNIFPQKTFGNGRVCSKNNAFEFNGAGKKQMSDNVIATKCAPSLCIWANLKLVSLIVSKINL